MTRPNFRRSILVSRTASERLKLCQVAMVLSVSLLHYKRGCQAAHKSAVPSLLVSPCSSSISQLTLKSFLRIRFASAFICVAI